MTAILQMGLTLIGRQFDNQLLKDVVSNVLLVGSFNVPPQDTDSTCQKLTTPLQLSQDIPVNTALTTCTASLSSQVTSQAPPNGLSQTKRFRRSSSGSDETVHDNHTKDGPQLQSEHRSQDQQENLNFDTDFPTLGSPASTNISSPPVLHLPETDPVTDTEYLHSVDTDFSTESSND